MKKRCFSVVDNVPILVYINCVVGKRATERRVG